MLTETLVFLLLVVGIFAYFFGVYVGWFLRGFREDERRHQV